MYRRSQPDFAILGLGTAFVAYALVSIQWSARESLWPTIELFSLVIAFALGYFVNLRVASLIVCLFTAANCLPAAVTSMGYFNMPHGLFGNPNFLGCAVVLALAAAIVYKFYWFYPFAAVGLWLSQSRGAFIGAVAAVLIGIWRRDRLLALTLALVLTATGIAISDGRSFSGWARIGVWQDTVNHLTVFGSGWGSFFTEYSSWPIRTNMTTELAPHAYNDFLQLTFELGIGTIPLWVLIAYSLETESPATLILLTGLALGLTYFPLRIPGIGHFMILSLGHMAFHRRRLWLVGN